MSLAVYTICTEGGPGDCEVVDPSRPSLPPPLPAPLALTWRVIFVVALQYLDLWRSRRSCSSRDDDDPQGVSVPDPLLLARRATLENNRARASIPRKRELTFCHFSSPAHRSTATGTAKTTAKTSAAVTTGAVAVPEGSPSAGKILGYSEYASA